MINKEALGTEFKNFCIANGLINGRVTIEEYNFDNNYFTVNENVWNKISIDDENGDENPNWERNQNLIEVDCDMWLRSDFPEPPADLQVTEELYTLLYDEGCITNEKDWTTGSTEHEINIKNSLICKEYKNLPKQIKADIKRFWESITVELVNENCILYDAIGIRDIESKYSTSGFIDDMAMWTVYYEPREASEENAWASNLMPFYYDGVFMLALGGCGTDFSPRLDCYQALTDKSIPSGSLAFNDINYFNGMSPLSNIEILDMCRLNAPRVFFIAEEAVKQLESNFQNSGN
jgi:hypothetical protein